MKNVSDVCNRLLIDALDARDRLLEVSNARDRLSKDVSDARCMRSPIGESFGSVARSLRLHISHAARPSGPVWTPDPLGLWERLKVVMSSAFAVTDRQPARQTSESVFLIQVQTFHW